MTNSTILTIIHTIVLSLYVFTIYCTFFVLNIPNFDKKQIYFNVGQLKFLTVWNVIAQTFFFLICLLNDIFGTNIIRRKKQPFIRKAKDFYHATIGFPVAIFVGLTFWGLMFIDRELVLPKVLDPYFPQWLNHLMHTMIMITTILEMIMTPRDYPKRLQGLTVLTAFMLIYLSWMHFLYYVNGIWAYPIIEFLTWPLRTVFYIFLLLLVAALYYVGESINRIIWEKTVSTVDNTKKLK